MGTEQTAVNRNTRFQAGLPATMELDGRDYECSAHNLSRSGLLLRGHLPAPAQGTPVRVSLRSVNDDLALDLVCTVARSFMGENSQRQIGLQYTQLDQDQRATLDALIARVIEGYTPAPLAKLADKATEEQIRKALEEIPVAHRMQLATRAKLREREFLMLDTAPQVLEALARNPGISLNEARELLKNRDLLPSTLEQMSRDKKLSRDEEIKILIASHPKVTMALAERVALSLNELSAQKVLNRPGLSQPVKLKLANALQRGKLSKTNRTW